MQVLAPMVANEGSISNNPSLDTDETPDFTVDDLTLLKEILLNLEKSVDNIQLSAGSETKHGGYIFSILEQANVGFFPFLHVELISEFPTVILT